MNKVTKVKRKAKIGEYLEIVNPWEPMGYHTGDIIRVTEERPSGIYAVIDGGEEYISDSEYVVLEGYTPEEAQ